MEIVGYVVVGLGVFVLGFAGFVALREIPSIGRYIRIHRM
jgi:hypothetical protein